MSQIKIFGDTSKGCIFFEGSTVAPKFLGTIQASEHPTNVERIIIVRTDRLKPGAIEFRRLFRRLRIDRVQNSLGEDLVNTLGFTRAQVINYINTESQATGSSVAGQAPSITSSTAVALTTGDTLNYELVADYGVGYEWSGLPSGLVPVEGNVRKLIGGSGLAAGSYTFDAKAVNYFGEDTETINLTVSNPPFQDSKSVFFDQNDYMGANAALADSTLGRTGGNTGTPWTISFWIKRSTVSNGQCLFYYGSNDTVNGGHIELRQVNTDRLKLKYGTNSNNIIMQTAVGSLPNAWAHVMVTYDGGTTGSSSADIADYYSRFNIFIDGVNQTTSNSHNNYGYTGNVQGQNLRLGKYVSGNTMRGGYIDEVSLHDADMSSDIADIYNSGSPRDLDSYSPTHWWRMGDGDTYPTIEDVVGNAHMVMYSMTAANIVSDVP